MVLTHNIMILIAIKVFYRATPVPFLRLAATDILGQSAGAESN